MPKGREARWAAAGERSGMLAHTTRRRKPRSALRLREPKRLPVALSASEAGELVGSLRTWRDRAIAVDAVVWPALVRGARPGRQQDVDIGGRWVTVTGKGNKQRRVPLDAPTSPR